MQIAITFRHLEPSEALKQHVHHKLEKIEKFLMKPVEVHVFLSVEKYLHRAEIKVEDKAFTAIATEESNDMYVSIDRAITKVGKSLRRHKDKVKDPKAHASSSTPTQS